MRPRRRSRLRPCWRRMDTSSSPFAHPPCFQGQPACGFLFRRCTRRADRARRGALEGARLCMSTTHHDRRTARPIHHVGWYRDRQDARHRDPVPPTDHHRPKGGRAEAGGFRVLARRSGERSRIDPAQPRPSARRRRPSRQSPPGGSPSRSRRIWPRGERAWRPRRHRSPPSAANGNAQPATS